MLQNVLSFAEESQTVQVTKCVDRLEVDENRPPVPRRFYVKWCHDVDENTEENENGVAFKCSMPPYSFKVPLATFLVQPSFRTIWIACSVSNGRTISQR